MIPVGSTHECWTVVGEPVYERGKPWRYPHRCKCGAVHTIPWQQSKSCRACAAAAREGSSYPGRFQLRPISPRGPVRYVVCCDAAERGRAITALVGHAGWLDKRGSIIVGDVLVATVMAAARQPAAPLEVRHRGGCI